MNFDRIAQFQKELYDIGIAGSDVAVYVDGKPVFRNFFGYQDMERNIPISDKTVYRMFSMTKPITCAAAMLLYEEGRFLMNDPVSDYMPCFDMKNMQVKQQDGSLKCAEKPMEVQHLFEMTAGFDYNLKRPSLLKLYEETKDNFTTMQFVEALAREPLNFESGTRWDYSLCHDVLAGLIESISGMTYNDFAQKRIFDPLGMKEAWFHIPEGELSRVCHRYGMHDGKYRNADEPNQYQRSPRHESGGAGVSMTIDDYAKFACMMTNRGLGLNGERILAGRTVDIMRRNRLDGQRMIDYNNGNPFDREDYGYGLGVRVNMNRGCNNYSALGEFGWAGAWGTYVLMDPENKVTIVYGEAAEDTMANYIRRRLRNMVYASLE